MLSMYMLPSVVVGSAVVVGTPVVVVGFVVVLPLVLLVVVSRSARMKYWSYLML